MKDPKTLASSLLPEDKCVPLSITFRTKRIAIAMTLRRRYVALLLEDPDILAAERGPGSERAHGFARACMRIV